LPAKERPANVTKPNHGAAKQLSTTVFVAATGYSTDEDRRKARQSGFDEYLVKPIELESLSKILAWKTYNRLRRRSHSHCQSPVKAPCKSGRIEIDCAK
jgi:CheY-like chemotaxis protein